METEKKYEALKLESMYPYTYVRTTVMRSKLLKRADYDRLLKMQFSEIARYLQDSEYKVQINEFAVKYSGVELLEISLLTNLAKTFERLRLISAPEINLMINEYLMKYDLLNVKTIIRGLYTKSPAENISKLIIPIGKIQSQQLFSVLKSGSIEEAVKLLPFLDFTSIQPYVKVLQEKGALFELENALDKYYYLHMVVFSNSLPQKGELFKKFLLAQIESINILTIVRLTKEGMHKDEIKKFIFFTGIREQDHEMQKMLVCKSIEEIANHVHTSSMKKFVHKCVEDYKTKKSITEFERQFSKHTLETAILFAHQHPLSIDVILGFMFAKEIEVSNLMKLIKGKELGIDEKIINQEIVV